MRTTSAVKRLTLWTLALALGWGISVQADGTIQPNPAMTEVTASTFPAAADQDLAQRVKAAVSLSQSASEFDGWSIGWSAIVGGGSTGSNFEGGSGNSLGQAFVGTVSGSDRQVDQGFWQTFAAESSCCDLIADVNNNGVGPDVADLIYMVEYMFQGGPDLPCPEESDVDGDGDVVIIADLVYLVEYMFQGGSAPVPCL